MRINDAGRALLIEYEGCALRAYPDPGTGDEPWTIGYGHTGSEVHPGLEITQDKAEQMLAQDVERFESAVSNFLQVSLNTNQFSALVCFAYNVKGWRSSHLFQYVRDGKFGDAAEEFHKWCHAGGKVLQGLVNRREAERHLFLTSVSKT